MSRKADPTKSKQYRIDHGLCPTCGKEAAPYYLCWDHRSIRSLTNVLNKGVGLGIFEAEKKNGRNTYFRRGPRIYDPNVHLTGTYLWDMDPDDKRLRPRMGRRPIDLDETLIGIFETAGKPLTMDEIMFAWGSLRNRRKTASLAGDMTAIVLAQRKRDERAAKRLAVMNKQPAATVPG